ncbi:hypothetical protein [Tenuifilum osseticum]|uniref:hypothetical protein n=1 Tax=Tenuifilum osseticum TaxID=3374723 RepID=UPI0034E556A2
MSKENEIKDFLTADSSSVKKKPEELLSVPSSPFLNIKRDLNEEDLKSPAVQRLLLSENDKLEHQVHRLEIFEEKFHSLDKECAVLKEKVSQNTAFEIIFTTCIAIGSALCGISSLYWSQKGYILLLIGLGLTLGGILAKIVKK